jgi:hypothetical protein
MLLRFAAALTVVAALLQLVRFAVLARILHLNPAIDLKNARIITTEWVSLLVTTLACFMAVLTYRCSAVLQCSDRSQNYGSVSRLFAVAILPVWPLLHFAVANPFAIPRKDWIAIISVAGTLPLVLGGLLLTTARFRYTPAWLAPAAIGGALAYYLSPAMLQMARIGAESGVIHIIMFSCAATAMVLLSYRLPLIVQSTIGIFAIAATLWGAGDGTLSNPYNPTRRVISQSTDRSLRPPKRPNIILLVYDAYPSATLARDQNFANLQLDMLRRGGFIVYESVYSLAPASLASMTRVLDMGPNDDIPIDGENQVATILKRWGYSTNLVLTPYFFGQTRKGYDHQFPSIAIAPSAKQSIINSLVAREFRSSFVFSSYSEADRIREKRRLLALETDTPLFVYAHSPFPSHSQNSGRCLPDERERYLARVQQANEEMTSDLAVLATRRDESIIIIASDHGPHLTGDCNGFMNYAAGEVSAKNLRDLYDVFLAIKWPTGFTSVPGDSLPILQHLFPMIFSRISQVSVDAGAVEALQSTVTYGNVPDSAVVSGIINFGKDSGTMLYPLKRKISSIDN